MAQAARDKLMGSFLDSPDFADLVMSVGEAYRLGKLMTEQGDDEGVGKVLAELKQDHAGDEMLGHGYYIVGEGHYDRAMSFRKNGFQMGMQNEPKKAVAVCLGRFYKQ